MTTGFGAETRSTSLGGKDLYPDPLAALTQLTFAPGHPVGFWLRMGYALVGVIPDAEGPGRRSINLAKRPAG